MGRRSGPKDDCPALLRGRRGRRAHQFGVNGDGDLVADYSRASGYAKILGVHGNLRDGYARVSTTNQDLSIQQRSMPPELIRFARRRWSSTLLG